MKVDCSTGMSAVAIVPCLTLALAVISSGCSRVAPPAQQTLATRVDAPALMIQYGCPTCHVIPHVPGAVGKVGPPLADLAQRSYLAGMLQNSPENLIHWIQHPQQIHPGTAMPEMNIPLNDAITIAAFLQANH